MRDCSEKFQVSSFKFVGRVSVPAKVGCAPRTMNRAPLSMLYAWGKGPRGTVSNATNLGFNLLIILVFLTDNR